MKVIITLLFLFVSSFAFAQIVTIPDANFKTALLTTNCVDTDDDGYGDIDADLNDDGEIQVTEAEAVLSLVVEYDNIVSIEGISAFINLESLNCSNNNIVTLDGISTLANLHSLDCSYNDIIALDMNFMTEVERFDCSSNDFTSLIWPALTSVGSGFICKNTNFLTTIDLSNLVHANSITFQDNGALTSLNLDNFTTAGYFQFVQNNDMLNLDVSSLTSATSVRVTFNDDLITIDLSGLETVTELVRFSDMDIDLTTIDLSSLTSVGGFLATNIDALTTLHLNNLQTVLDFTTTANTGSGDFVLIGVFNLNNLELESLESVFNNFQISGGFDVANLSNLTTVGYDFSIGSSSLTNTNLSGLVSVGHDFNYASAALGTLDLSSLVSVEDITADFAELTAIELSSLPTITHLTLSGNFLTSIDLSSLEEADRIYLDDNNLTSINVDNLINVQYEFDASENELVSLELTSLTYVRNLSLSLNPIVNINFGDTEMSSITIIGANQIQALDLSTVSVSGTINVQNSAQLEYLFIKNGSTSNNLYIVGLPNIQYICTDDNEVDLVQGIVDGLGYTNCNINTYCSFVPGGDYNTISGNATYDSDNNGCDVSDLPFPFLKLNMNDGVETVSTFTTNTGVHNFYTQDGNFTVTPDIENSSFFNVSPIDATINFTDTNNNIEIQDFCITANGIHPDIEIAMAPIITARPGFDAEYLITYKNKGNLTLSGNVDFSFDDTVLDFVSSTENPTTQTSGFLSWDYNNLFPFESRSIYVTLNVNSPMETPAINIDDQLDFTVNANPIVGDDFPADNTFDYKQVVVGAYDPNDITCIQGDMVEPSEIGNYLHYVINFENTGNAAAENVVIKIEIDPTQFNIGTIRLLSSSHNPYVRVKGNIAEFIFENIYLEASGTGSGGHGHILLRMQTNPNLQTNDTVTKDAEIFFDYNFPIETNDADTTFAVLNDPEFTFDKSVSLYPNPVKDILNIKANNTINSVSVYDVQGRLLQTKLNSNNEIDLDLSERPNGIYFVKINTNNGINVEKIIKQ